MAKDKPNFESVLDWPSEMIERPKPLPAGTYLTVLQGQPPIGRSSQKQTEYSEYTHKILEAGDDVDEDDLKAYLTSPDGSKRKLQECSIKQQFYHTDKSIFMLKEFCKTLGIEVGKGTNPRQWMAETAGKQCLIHVKHRPWQTGEGVSANIDKTMSVDEE